MSTDLVTIGKDELSQGGQGIDYNSKLFQLKPATVVINQPNTQAEGAKKGKLRIVETGDQFDFMDIALLVQPTESRAYHPRAKGQLPTLENRMCYSYDMLRPNKGAVNPQAITCASCAQSSWEKYEQNRIPENAPQCQPQYKALFIDTVFRMPLQMYIRSQSRQPFERGMKVLVMKFAQMQSQGLKPNIFDIKFRISSTEVQNKNSTKSFIPKFSDFAAINEAERELFGEVYLKFINRGKQAVEQELANEVAEQDAVIDAEVLTPGTEGPNVEEGEIQI